MADLEILQAGGDETQENNERRDDVLERQFITGQDRDQDVWAIREREHSEDRSRRLQRDDEMFHIRMSQRDKLDDLEARRRERAEVESDDRDGLRFRDAAIHSTAVGSLEGEIATVGDEEEENVPDEDNANTGKKA